MIYIGYNDFMIILYTKGGCRQTKDTKLVLDSMGLEYKVILLSSDSRLAKSFTLSGCTQTPIVVTANTAWQGHQPEKLAELK